MAQAFYQNVKTLTENEFYRIFRQFDRYISKENSCHTWHGRKDAYGYGEMLLQFRGVRLGLKVHRVVFALDHPNISLNSASYDVSHLCHNRLCVNVQHLSYEPHSINNNRLVCKNDGECHGHYGFKDCLL